MQDMICKFHQNKTCTANSKFNSSSKHKEISQSFTPSSSYLIRFSTNVLKLCCLLVRMTRYWSSLYMKTAPACGHLGSKVSLALFL